MTAPKRWLLAAALVALLATGAWRLRPRLAPEPVARPEVAGAAQGQRGAAGNAAAASGATTALAAPAPGAPPQSAPASAAERAALFESQRVMPYRPAHPLWFSLEPPSKNPNSDELQDALHRVLDLTDADAEQSAKIRALWRTHEDGRRVLHAEAYPRVSGPRILDREKLAVLDNAFEAALLNDVLRPAQAARLLRERPAPGTEMPPATLYERPQ